jgi:hypothetical protein
LALELDGRRACLTKQQLYQLAMCAGDGHLEPR